MYYPKCQTISFGQIFNLIVVIVMWLHVLKRHYISLCVSREAQTASKLQQLNSPSTILLP